MIPKIWGKKKEPKDDETEELDISMGLPIGKEALEQVLSPEPILRAVSYTLLGLQPNPLDPDKWTFFDKDRKPPINEKGVSWILMYLRNYVNQNVFLSVYDKNQIEYKLRNLHMELSFELYQRHKEFDVEIQQLDSIVTIIMQGAQSALLRALDGRTLDMVAKVFQISQKMGMEKRRGDMDW